MMRVISWDDFEIPEFSSYIWPHFVALMARDEQWVVLGYPAFAMLSTEGSNLIKVYQQDTLALVCALQVVGSVIKPNI
ncbi:hypothetical protein GBA52_024710 [Prunus armeniaca]|nr:hypothetical protein GBA52_024710 [Prunus armeniaca]